MITERADGQPQHVLVALREMLPGAAIVDEDLLEARTGQAIANAARDFAEVEAFTGGSGGPSRRCTRRHKSCVRTSSGSAASSRSSIRQTAWLGNPRRQFVSRLRVSFHRILESLARFFDGSHPAVCPAC